MSELFQQLKDKHLVRTAVVYVGGAWLMLEATGFFVDTYALSRDIVDVVVLLVVLGFPAALIIAWFHGAKGRQDVARVEAALLLTLAVLAAVGTYRITSATELASGDAASDAAAPAARLVTDDLGERSIAVLPFSNATGLDSLDWVGSGVSDMLTTSLARGGAMRVVSPQRLFELLRSAGREETDQIPDDVAMQVAGEAGARRMVRGSVLGTLDDLVLDVQMIDLTDGTVVAGDRVRGDDVFAMADSLAEWVTGQFASGARTPRLASGGPGAWGPSRPPPAVTGDPERLKEYSLALRSAWSAEGVDGRYRVVDLLEEWPGRESEVRDALEQIVAANPEDIRALGDLVRVAANQVDVVALDSLVPRYTAVEDDPARAQMTVGKAYERIGQSDRARRTYREMIAEGVGGTDPLDRLVRTYLTEGRPADARAELERLDPTGAALARRARLLVADTYAWEGEFDRALALYREVEGQPESPTRSAAIESRLAVEWLLDPSQGATRLNQVVWTLLERNRPQDALNVIEGDEHLYVRDTDRIPPIDAHVLAYERARALEALGMTNDAIAAYDQLREDWGRVLDRLPLLADAAGRRAALGAS